MVLAAEMPATIERIYAHFLHTPASVARYAAIMRGLPWSGSGHAKDIWTSQEWELRRKLADADWLITCTKVAFTRLKDLVADSSRVQLFYQSLFDFVKQSSTQGGVVVQVAPIPPVVTPTIRRLVF